VGNVVMLGVDVSGFDCVTEWELVPLEHREPPGDGLADCDLLIGPLGDWVFDNLAVSVCLGLNETVVDDDDDLLFLLEGVYDTEELLVLELLVEPDTDLVAILLIEVLELNVEEVVAVSAGELVELMVFCAVWPVVIVDEDNGVSVLVLMIEALTLFVICSLNEILLVAEGDEEILDVFVWVPELVIDLVITWVFVSLIDPVPHGDDVDVFDEDIERVNVVEAEFVLVPWIDCVVVLVDLAVPVVVTLPVDVLELDTLRDPLGEDVVVLEADVDWVPLIDTLPVSDPRVVFVKDGEAEEVFDEAIVRVCVTLLLVVFDGGALLVEHGLALELLEVVLELVVVRVFTGVTDRWGDSVEVLLEAIDLVTSVLAEAVLETDVVLLDVIDAVVVFVEVVLSVSCHVGLVDLVDVVVFVEVFDCVAELEGNTKSTESILFAILSW